MITTVDYLDIANAIWYNSKAISIEAMLREAWGRLGLNPEDTLYCGTTRITFGEIVTALTEVAGTVTVTRQ
jgi:hypothetical protein